MNENDRTRGILQYLALRQVVAWRQNNHATPAGVGPGGRMQFRAMAGVPGVPDILGILPDGRFLGVEVKSGTGRQSKAQRSFEKMIKGNNGVYKF